MLLFTWHVYTCTVHEMGSLMLLLRVHLKALSTLRSSRLCDSSDYGPIYRKVMQCVFDPSGSDYKNYFVHNYLLQ
jgi:hypothetical protein